MRRISRTRAGVRSTLLGQLLDGGLALELLDHLALHAVHLVDRLDHVHRDADGAGLVGDGPGDGLADPPRGVGGELEALRVVELLDRPHQTQVALLDEVEEQHAPADVALGDGHHQAQVGLGQLLPWPARRRAARRSRPSCVRPGRCPAEPLGAARSARCVLGLPCPASMRWARSTSSAPVSSGTRPISFRYIRTGIGDPEARPASATRAGDRGPCVPDDLPSAPRPRSRRASRRGSPRRYRRRQSSTTSASRVTWEVATTREPGLRARGSTRFPLDDVIEGELAPFPTPFQQHLAGCPPGLRAREEPLRRQCLQSCVSSTVS